MHNLSLSLVAGALDDSSAKGGSMASSGKPKTTRAKLQREAVLRERRLDKAARKQVRKQAQLDPSLPDGLDALPDELDVLPDELDTGAPETGVDASVPSAEPSASL